MERIAVLYATKTKHSKKLAEVIGSALKVKAKNITENPTLHDIDLLFIVGGIYGGASMPELLTFIKEMEAPALTHTVLVTSCASGKQRQDAVRRILEEKGISVLDEFVCKGAILFVSLTHPNAKDLQAATDFALEIVRPNS
ncbi:flavodoxin domain-containing protein [Acetobacterium sp.]|uniref:flavodoxin domain-containing protein n=1 Tax=Acetobacterium sp. TaxID=1872094 RepID=UPI003593E3E4